MEFRDVPSLQRFAQHARANTHCEITMDCYKRIREVIQSVKQAPNVIEHHLGMPQVEGLKESCAAVERATRLLWACAAATEHVNPPMWDYTPDYLSAIEYFGSMADLELMAVTKQHRIVWDQVITPQGAEPQRSASVAA